MNSYIPNLLGTQALTPAPDHHAIIHLLQFPECQWIQLHVNIHTLSLEGVAESVGLS